MHVIRYYVKTIIILSLSSFKLSLLIFITSGLQQNQTVEYEAEIFSFNSRGRSEVVRLLKITLNAEEIVATLRMLGKTILTNYIFIIQTWLQAISLGCETVFKGFWFEWPNHKSCSGGKKWSRYWKIYKFHCWLTRHGHKEIDIDIYLK